VIRLPEVRIDPEGHAGLELTRSDCPLRATAARPIRRTERRGARSAVPPRCVLFPIGTSGWGQPSNRPSPRVSGRATRRCVAAGPVPRRPTGDRRPPIAPLRRRLMALLLHERAAASSCGDASLACSLPWRRAIPNMPPIMALEPERRSELLTYPLRGGRPRSGCSAGDSQVADLRDAPS
jgi:hypothetical protein